MTAVLVCLEGRSLGDAVDQCLRGAVTGTPARRRVWSVWLSGALARPFLFGPVHGLRTWSEASSAAESAARQACGFDGPCRVALEGDPSLQTVLGTAVQQVTIEAIERIAGALRIRVKSIRPAWAEAIDAAPPALRGASMLACRDADSLTLLGMGGVQYDLASTYSPRPGIEEIESLLRRLHLSREAAPGAMLDAAITAAANGAPNVAWGALEPVAA